MGSLLLWQWGSRAPTCLSPASLLQALLIPVKPKVFLQLGVPSLLEKSMHLNTSTMYSLWTYSTLENEPSEGNNLVKGKERDEHLLYPCWALGTGKAPFIPEELSFWTELYGLDIGIPC